MSQSTSAPRQLESYACGRWQKGQGEAQPLHSAATGEVVALIDATGLDYQAMLDYGRKQGAALRAMTVHERALMLKEIGLALLDLKDELYACSTQTGATRSDSWIDIDGGIGTMLSYSSKGRRELPNTKVLLDGDLEPLSRDGSFSAQHILTPKPGVAIHINAFNFPCWGMLEKLAPTWLAGMLAIVKPASQTAYLTELVVRKILDTNLLPEGALQLICGSTGDLLEHVQSQDVVTFTGSASTGRMLRATPAIINNSVPFNMEADSLNATVLGTDVTADSIEFEMLIKEVVNEMTSKAGQKCTAIRRVMVPRAMTEVVCDALKERLEKIRVGDPALETTQMGPLASPDQRAEVQQSVEQLLSETTLVCGAADGGDAGVSGCYYNPVLLYCAEPMQAQKVHEIEAFGPVATVMPYDDLEQAITLVEKGGGSLVTSVFSYDPEVARTLVVGMAAYNGRIFVSNRDSQKSATGHGSPMPTTVHGGPGRAGGGEELGGIRSILHYMQRTAVQGPPNILTAVTSRWFDGAQAQHDSRHPFRKSLKELRVGDQIFTDKRTITIEDIEHFAEFTGDNFYAHMDEEAAKANPFFDGRVAHGYLVVSFVAGLFIDPDPGPVLANYGVDNLRFLTPVYAGDTLSVQFTCKEINPRVNADYGEVRWDCKVTNQNDALIAQYDVLTMVAK